MTKKAEKSNIPLQPSLDIAGVKCRFFVQYWGVKCMYVGGVGLVEIGTGGWNLKHPYFFLELKPLSKLTDEDAIEYFDIQWHETHKSKSKEFKIEYGKEWANSINSERFGLIPSNIVNGPSCLSHGSLFSGIGGFDLAAQWMGWNNIFQVEKDDWCRKVLAKNFPKTERFADIKDFTGHEYTNRIDVISGGFPCQPFSVAGQRKGKDDDRYLWEEMLRVIATIKPTYVVGENVTGIIGLALDTVLSDLEAQDYTTETFIIPACGKNAWHRRDRVWIVAYANSLGRQDEQKENGKPICNGERNNTIEEQSGEQQQRRISKSSSVFSDTTAQGFQERRSETMVRPEQQQELKRCSGVSTNTDNTGCEEQRQPITNGKELFAPKCSSWWETEPGVGRVVDGLSGRVDRLKGLGNAIVPQVAFEIFSAIGAVSRHGA